MNARHVSLLVRMELTRRYRSFFGVRRRVAILAIASLFFLPFIGGIVFAMYFFGGEIATGNVDVPMRIVRAIGAGAVVGIALMSTIRAVQTSAVPVNADSVLLTASHREVVTSVVVVEVLTTGGIFGIIGLLGVVAFGIGAGSVPAGLVTGAALVGVLLLGTTLGLALGFTVRNAIARSEFLARYKTAIGILLFLGYFVALTTVGGADEGSESIFLTAGVVLGRTPLGWFGDLALLGVTPASDATLATGALLLAGAGALGAGLAIDRLARLLWYEKPAEGTRETEESASMGDIRGVPRPIARIAWKSWLRAWRSPIRLLYVVYPLFAVVGPLSDAVQTGQVPSYLPAFVALYGGWATGAAFTLNPIGDETDVLPITLTTPVGGRTFMAGSCLAGILIGVPVTASLVVALAIAAGMDVPTIGGAAVLGLAVPCGATLLATGVGAALPRLEAVNVTRGRKAVVPSLFGFVVYSLALTILAAPGLLVSIPAVRDVLADTGTPTATVHVGGIGLAVVLLGALGAASFRYAAGTFDRYHLG